MSASRFFSAASSCCVAGPQQALLFGFQIGEALALDFSKALLFLGGSLLLGDEGLLLRSKLLLQLALAAFLLRDLSRGFFLLLPLERLKLLLQRALPVLLRDHSLLALADFSGLDRLGARFGGLAAALGPPRWLLRGLGENDALASRRVAIAPLRSGRCKNRPDEKAAIRGAGVRFGV